MGCEGSDLVWAYGSKDTSRFRCSYPIGFGWSTWQRRCSNAYDSSPLWQPTQRWEESRRRAGAGQRRQFLRHSLINAFRFSVPLNPPANQISKIASIQSPLLNFINISIPSVAGETYQLQFRTDLTSGIWSNVPSASVTNSLGGLLTLGTTTGAKEPQAFYRFDITP